MTIHSGSDADPPRHALCHGCHTYRPCYRGRPMDDGAAETQYLLRWESSYAYGGERFSALVPRVVNESAPERHVQWWCQACLLREIAAALSN